MRLGPSLLLAIALAACDGSDVSRMIGARCDDSSECDDKCLLPAAEWPGGFCTLSCDDDSDCEGRAACVQDEGGVCLFTCVEDLDCAFLGETWRCLVRAGRPDGDVKVCRGG